MAHFRGQIRGPHWGANRDNILIDFWKRHECLFNSSLESFYDRDMKTKLWSECALLIGKSGMIELHWNKTNNVKFCPN